MIDARRIALMKPGSCLINTARAEVVDQEAMIAALESGHLAGAGLDVYESEPAPPQELHVSVLPSQKPSRHTSPGQQASPIMPHAVHVLVVASQNPPSMYIW